MLITSLYRPRMERAWVVDVAEGSEIRIWVVPGSSRRGIFGVHDGRLRVRVPAPAQGGRANDEASKVLSRALGTTVRLSKGMKSRAKTFQVDRLSADDVVRKLHANT